MRAHYVSEADLETLLDPHATAWERGEVENLKLEGTPLGMQPSAQIQAAWKDRTIGAVPGVRVAAAHDGRILAFHLEWHDPTENGAIGDNDRFVDAAAIVLPAAAGAPIFTMGAPGLPVNAWYWRADAARGRDVVAEGIGTSRTVDAELVHGRGEWKEGRWRVVIARVLRVDTPEPVAQLQPGETTGFGVAVWDGANNERAGIKSFSGPQWLELRLDGLPQARR